MSMGGADSTHPTGNFANEGSDVYGSDTLLQAYKHFICPQGIEEHSSIYSPQCLLPELFSPDPPFWQVVATGPRVKRPLSDLTDRPRGAGTQTARNRDNIDASHMSVKPKQRSVDGRTVPGASRVYNEYGPTFGQGGRGAGGFRTSRPDLNGGPFDRADSGQVGPPNVRYLRPMNGVAVDGGRMAERTGIRPSAPGGLTMSNPHTAESWERLGQKLRATSKLGSEEHGGSNDFLKSTDRGTDDMIPAPSSNFEDERGYSGGHNRRLPDEVMDKLLDGELYQENFMDSQTQPLIPDQRFGLPMDRGGAAGYEAGVRNVRNVRGVEERNTFQQLLAKTHSAERAPPQSGGDISELNRGEVDPQRLRAMPGPPPPIWRQHNLTDFVIRWTDGRPLYLTQYRTVARDLAQELRELEAHVRHLRNDIKRRETMELYETKIASFYDQLVRMRQVTLPDPLKRAMKISPTMSLALWPSFREVFLESESLLDELNRWEADVSQRPVPQSRQHEQSVPDRNEPETIRGDLPFTDGQRKQWHTERNENESFNGDPVVLGGQHYNPSVHMGGAFPSRQPELQNANVPLSSPTMTESFEASADVRSPFRSGWGSNAANVRGPPTPAVPSSGMIPPPHHQPEQQSLPMTWEYLDPHKVVQGPFSSEKMFNWWRRDFFPEDLPVRPDGYKSFFALSTLYPPELEARFKPFIDRPPFKVVENQQADSVPGKATAESVQPSYAAQVRSQQRANADQAPSQGRNHWQSNTSAPMEGTIRSHPLPQMPKEIMNEHERILPVQMSATKPEPLGYNSVAAGRTSTMNPPVRSVQQDRAPSGFPSSETNKHVDTIDSAHDQIHSGQKSTSSDPRSPASQLATESSQQRTENHQIEPTKSSSAGKNTDVASPTSQGNAWSERAGPAAWTNRVIDHGDSLSKSGVGDQEDMGPSLAESRYVPKVHDDHQAALSKSSKKKFKGKKQSLGDIIINKGLEQNSASVWGNRPVPPPRKESAWIQIASANIGAREGSDSPPLVKMPETRATPITAAEIVKANLPSAKKDGPAPPTNTKNPTPSAQKPIPVSSDIQNNGSTSTSASPAIRSVGVEIYDEQKEAVGALCTRHNIVVDSDFIGLLLGCEDIDDASSLLSDNLGNSESEIEAFVQEFWDLVRNPFKPVQKGTGSNSRGAGNKSSVGGMMSMGTTGIDLKPSSTRGGRRKANKKR